VKKQIEDLPGKKLFPCAQQLLIHQGKELKDDTILDENKVSEEGFLVVTPCLYFLVIRGVGIVCKRIECTPFPSFLQIPALSIAYARAYFYQLLGACTNFAERR
jgi:hypothetical protein